MVLTRGRHGHAVHGRSPWSPCPASKTGTPAWPSKPAQHRPAGRRLDRAGRAGDRGVDRRRQQPPRGLGGCRRGGQPRPATRWPGTAGQVENRDLRSRAVGRVLPRLRGVGRDRAAGADRHDRPPSASKRSDLAGVQPMPGAAPAAGAGSGGGAGPQVSLTSKETTAHGEQQPRPAIAGRGLLAGACGARPASRIACCPAGLVARLASSPTTSSRRPSVQAETALAISPPPGPMMDWGGGVSCGSLSSTRACSANTRRIAEAIAEGMREAGAGSPGPPVSAPTEANRDGGRWVLTFWSSVARRTPWRTEFRRSAGEWS